MYEEVKQQVDNYLSEVESIVNQRIELWQSIGERTRNPESVANYIENQAKWLGWIDSVKRQKDTQRFPVAVIGHFSSGKSTLLNALLGKYILPDGLSVATARLTHIRHVNDCPEKGQEGFYIKHFGHSTPEPKRYDVEELDKFVLHSSEENQKKEIENIERVYLYVDSDWLAKGIELIDSPGLEGEQEHNAITDDLLKEVGAILYVMNASGTHLSSKEIEYLKKLKGVIGEERFSNIFMVLGFRDNSPERNVDDQASWDAKLDELHKKATTEIDASLNRDNFFAVSAMYGLIAREKNKDLSNKINNWDTSKTLDDAARENILKDSGLPPFETALKDFLFENPNIRLRLQSLRPLLSLRELVDNLFNSVQTELDNAKQLDKLTLSDIEKAEVNLQEEYDNKDATIQAQIQKHEAKFQICIEELRNKFDKQINEIQNDLETQIRNRLESRELESEEEVTAAIQASKMILRRKVDQLLNTLKQVTMSETIQLFQQQFGEALVDFSNQMRSSLADVPLTRPIVDTDNIELSFGKMKELESDISNMETQLAELNAKIQDIEYLESMQEEQKQELATLRKERTQLSKTYMEDYSREKTPNVHYRKAYKGTREIGQGLKGLFVGKKVIDVFVEEVDDSALRDFQRRMNVRDEKYNQELESTNSEMSKVRTELEKLKDEIRINTGNQAKLRVLKEQFGRTMTTLKKTAERTKNLHVQRIINVVNEAWSDVRSSILYDESCYLNNMGNTLKQDGHEALKEMFESELVTMMHEIKMLKQQKSQLEAYRTERENALNSQSQKLGDMFEKLQSFIQNYGGNDETKTTT